MSQPSKTGYDLGQTYTLFWFGVFSCIVVLGVVIGALGTQNIKAPSYSSYLVSNQMLTDYFNINKEVQELKQQVEMLKKDINEKNK